MARNLFKCDNDKNFGIAVFRGLEKEIDVAISGKRFEQMIMSIVPGGIIFYMQITSEGFLDVLYHSTFGVLIMSFCLAIYIFSFWMGRKIIRISI